MQNRDSCVSPPFVSKRTPGLASFDVVGGGGGASAFFWVAVSESWFRGPCPLFSPLERWSLDSAPDSPRHPMVNHSP
eukprot:7811589-Karenia_brevis.AAC.1